MRAEKKLEQNRATNEQQNKPKRVYIAKTFFQKSQG